MTSPTDICNRVLSNIGTQSTITSFEDSSVEAVQCGLWYDVMRKRLLRTAPWGFARFELILAQLQDQIPDNTAPYPFLFGYAYPSDCIKFRYTIPPPVPPLVAGQIVPPLTGDQVIGPTWRGPSRRNRYVIHTAKDGRGNLTREILSNVQNAYGVYTGDVDDPDIFDDLFTDALESALAFKLCMPLSGNVAMREEYKATAEQAIVAARVADANEAIPDSDVRVDWLDVRGTGSAWGYAPWSGVGWGAWNGQWDNMNWSM